MDIIVRSSDPATFLILRDIQVSPGAAEFQIAVSSRGFIGEIPYAQEIGEISSLLVSLREMHANLRGSALLRFRYEETKVSFSMNPLGQVLVSGVLTHYEEPVHRLEFGFWSDQSCLPEVIAGLEGILLQMKD